MTTYNLSISQNPNFNTINSLTNITFDPNNIRSGHMATEDQIQQLWQDIIRLEERIDYCCREIVYWDIRVQIRDKFGNIVSSYLENRTTGVMRRGKPYTMTFPLKAVPKYEGQIVVSNSQLDENCPPSSATGEVVKNLCDFFYRKPGSSYYDLSQRQGSLVPVSWRNGTTTPSTTLTLRAVNANGVENWETTTNGALQNTHFASADLDGNVTIDVAFPITNAAQYGRVYYFDWRDVTLGG